MTLRYMKEHIDGYQGCVNCPLRRKRLVPPRGARDADVVIVGEGPGRTELREGRVFIGPSGKLLQGALDSCNGGDTKVWITNAALCFTSQSSQKEAAAVHCRQRLLTEIKYMHNATRVIALGNIALRSIIPTHNASMTKSRGYFYGAPDLDVPVLATWHPAAVLRRPETFTDFLSDMRKGTGAFERDIKDADWVVKVVESKEELQDFLNLVDDSRVVALDMETSGFSCFDDYLLCAVMTLKKMDGELETIIIPRRLLYQEGVGEIIENAGMKYVGHGSKFDVLFLRAQGIVSRDFAFADDTMLMHYLLDERRGTHNLKTLCAYIFDVPDWEQDIRTYLKKPASDSYSKLPTPVLYRYAAYDGIYTYMLYEHFKRELAEYPRLQWVYENLLVPGAQACVDMELNGVKIDENMLVEMDEVWSERLVELEAEMQELVGDPDFNPRSTKQLARWLFDVYGLDSGMGRTTNYHALRELSSKHPLADKMLEYRHIHKRQRTYAKGWGDQISEHDLRIHAYFQLHGTVSGRLACSRPNLQNLPYDLEELIIAEPGNVLVQTDYSQAELRMMAIQAMDPWLLDIYRRDGDLHTERALQIFGEDYTKEQRVFCKRIHFGLMYGRSIVSIARDTNLPGVSMRDAENLADGFIGKMPDFVGWRDGTLQQMREQGFVESLVGRRRRFPLITYNNQSEMGRQVISFMCQSPASDGMLTGLIEVCNKYRDDPEVKIILSVHDSIIAECPVHRAMEVATTMKQLMEDAAARLFGDIIPIKVDISIGTDKMYMKEVDAECTTEELTTLLADHTKKETSAGQWKYFRTH